MLCVARQVCTSTFPLDGCERRVLPAWPSPNLGCNTDYIRNNQVYTNRTTYNSNACAKSCAHKAYSTLFRCPESHSGNAPVPDSPGVDVSQAAQDENPRKRNEIKI